jgi:hypothetical protein
MYTLNKKPISLKKLFAILFTALILACTSKKEPPKIPIIIDQEAKAAGFNIFYVPLKLEGIEKEFKMQFDLGLDVSAIYGNALQAINEKYPRFSQNVFQRSDYEILKTKYSIGNYLSEADSLFVFADYGTEGAFQEQEVIGSIGVNQFKNKVLLINYSELYIQIIDNPEKLELANIDFTPMKVTPNNKIIIQLKAGSKQADYLFDTGNGVPILTLNKSFFDEQTDNQKESTDTISGNSWGEIITLYGAKQQKVIGTQQVNFTMGNYRTYYTQANRIVALYSDLKVEHSIGNDFFMDRTVVFDFINNRFGVSL